jgi:hypothetical protein
MSKGRLLPGDEIEELLNPTPKGRAVVITADGKKHYGATGKLPSSVVGSFDGTAGNKRNYKPGDPTVVAYKEGSE